MDQKICFVTSNFVGEKFKSPDIPGKFSKIEGWDYFLFTNLKKEVFGKCSWDIKEIDFPEIKDSVIKSRVPKFQIWQIEEMKKYDIVVYCDAYWTPTGNKRAWFRLFDELKKSKSGIIQGKNPYRDCAYEECLELVRLKKDSKERMEKTIQFLQTEGLEKKSGLYRNTFLVYQQKNQNVKLVFDHLWNLFKNGNYTHRDQPLYSLSVKQTEIYPDTFNLQPYFNMNGIISKHIYS